MHVIWISGSFGLGRVSTVKGNCMEVCFRKANVEAIGLYCGGDWFVL